MPAYSLVCTLLVVLAVSAFSGMMMSYWANTNLFNSWSDSSGVLLWCTQIFSRKWIWHLYWYQPSRCRYFFKFSCLLSINSNSFRKSSILNDNLVQNFKNNGYWKFCNHVTSYSSQVRLWFCNSSHFNRVEDPWDSTNYPSSVVHLANLIRVEYNATDENIYLHLGSFTNPDITLANGYSVINHISWRFE